MPIHFNTGSTPGVTMTYKELDKYLKEYGKRAIDIAKELNISLFAVHAWRRRDCVPKIHEKSVESLLAIYKKNSLISVKAIIYRLGGYRVLAEKLNISKYTLYWWAHVNVIPEYYSRIIKVLLEEQYRTDKRQSGIR